MSPRTKRIALAAAAAAVALVAAGSAGAWLARADDGRVPPGVVVEGVEVGGRPHDEARALLRRAVERRYDEPIELSVDDVTVATTPADLGAEPAIDEALAEAEERRGPLGRLAARLGLADPVEIPLGARFDRDRLEAELDRIGERVEADPSPAGVEVRDGELAVVPAEPGRELDRDALAERLADLPRTVEVPVRETPPEVTDADAERARARAQALADDPPAVRFRDTRRPLGERRLLRAFRFEADDGSLAVRLDEETLEPPLRQAFGDYEQRRRDASFDVRGERVEIRESRVGRTFDLPRTVAALEDADPGETVEAVFDVNEPGFTTAEAREMGIRELVSQFETPYACCPPRVTNIRRGAEILDGHIVRSGETFSLNETLGERTRERGFVPAPVILGERLVDAVGGGVSQIATTVFNAAFFAGLELVAHTPHSLYIDRYPMGREATVATPEPDLVFMNDWDAAVLVRVEATDTSIAVRFYSSDLGRRVETETGEPYDRRPPETRTRENPDLAPGERRVVQEAGEAGFSVDYTRTVWRGDEIVKDETFSATYEPQHRIVEVGPSQ